MDKTNSIKWSRGVSKLKGLVDSLEIKRVSKQLPQNRSNGKEQESDRVCHDAELTELITSFTLAPEPNTDPENAYETTRVIATIQSIPISECQDRDKLEIKWFRATLGGSFEVIDNVTSFWYQPSVDDIDSRICAQLAVKDTDGMISFAEYGPVELNPEVEVQTNVYMKAVEDWFVTNTSNSESVVLRFSLGQDALYELGKRIVEFRCSARPSDETSKSEACLVVSLFSINEKSIQELADEFEIESTLDLGEPLISLRAAENGLDFSITASSSQQLVLSNQSKSASFNLYCSTSRQRDVLVLTFRKLCNRLGIVASIPKTTGTADKQTSYVDNAAEHQSHSDNELTDIPSDSDEDEVDSEKSDSVPTPTSPPPIPPPTAPRRENINNSSTTVHGTCIGDGITILPAQNGGSYNSDVPDSVRSLLKLRKPGEHNENNLNVVDSGAKVSRLGGADAAMQNPDGVEEHEPNSVVVEIANEVVESESIANEVVESESIANEVVESESIANEVVESESIANEVVESESIANEVVESESIANEVAESEPDSNEVNGSKLKSKVKSKYKTQTEENTTNRNDTSHNELESSNEQQVSLIPGINVEEVTKRNNQSKEIEPSKRDMMKTILKQEATVSNLSEKVKSLERELQDSTLKHADVSRQLEEKNALLERSAVDTDELCQQLQVYKDKLASNQTALDILTEELSNVKVEKAKQSSTTVIETGKALAEIQTQQKIVAELEIKLQQTQHDLQHANNRNERDSQLLVEKEGELKSYKQQVSEKTRLMAQMALRLESEEEKVKGLETEINKLVLQGKEAESRYKQDVEELHKLQLKYDTLDQRYMKQEEELKVALSSLETSLAKRNALQQKVDSLAKDVGRIVNAAGTDELHNIETVLLDNQKLKTELSAERTKTESMSAKLESIEMQRQSVLGQQSAVTNKLQGTEPPSATAKKQGPLMAMTQSLFSDASSAPRNSRRANSNATAQVKQLQLVANSLMETLSERDESLAMQRHTNKLLSERVLELEAELVQLKSDSNEE